MSATTHQFHMHHDPADQVGKRERLGVRLLILADGSFVFGMIFSYLYLRNLDVNGGWLPNNGTVMDMQSGWMVALPFAAISSRPSGLACTKSRGHGASANQALRIVATAQPIAEWLLT